MTGATDANGGARGIDGQDDGLGAGVNSPLDVLPGNVEVVDGVELFFFPVSELKADNRQGAQSKPYLLEDDLAAVEGVVALDSIELLDGLGGVESGLDVGNSNALVFFFFSFFRFFISSKTHGIQNVLVTTGLHKVQLGPLRVAVAGVSSRGNEERGAEVVPEQFNAVTLVSAHGGLDMPRYFVPSLHTHPMLFSRSVTSRIKRGRRGTFFQTSRLLR